ncbi:MAG TPA: sugar kinase [Geminicoccus sp.]|jgi:2-dehydro-3-deoxygluconokinase|uniref:sugar kinase n=1 Tax=Geminicoccus sp. TaxID=2024832 RepID=UPI002E3101A1|nr:sugar kinase [Geminicoccus sp.]HEX2527354.1 sugar kinase [Geminicoccus sp.]
MRREFDLVAFGEPLMEFAEVERAGERLYLPGLGGDTSNVIVAAARQDARTAFIGAVGADPFGRAFLELWDREGVDRTGVAVPRASSTGIYFISYGPDGHEFSYRRAGSASSLVTPEDVPEELVRASAILHVSGISQAISTSACDAVFHAIRVARDAGARVAYDPNLRLRLWPIDRARAIVDATVRLTDVLLPGLDDARQLTGLDEPAAICAHYLAMGPGVVALTMGKNGTMIATPQRCEVIPVCKVEAVDATGAGDVFDGSFLTSWLESRDPFAAARYANAAAALSTLGHGAVAPIPRRPEVEAFLAAQGQDGTA